MEDYIIALHKEDHSVGNLKTVRSCIEWLLVDLLLDNSTITGVATQGCSSRTSKSVLSVTKYELEFSNDSKAFYADHRVSLFRFSYNENPKLIYLSLEFHKADILFF